MRWRHHCHPGLWVVDQMLPNDQTCFDSFPKANFVCEKVTLHGIRENPTDRGYLMRGKFNACRNKRSHSLSGATKIQ
jgi:hypothetical protein